jgi:hypothetical protein
MDTQKDREGNFFIKKGFTNGFRRYIIMDMNENRTICSSIQALELSLLLLRL